MIFIKKTNVLDKLYHNRFVSRLFHTSVYCLKRELENCNSVLDLGCGSDSPIKYCNVYHSVGVDSFKPSIRASKKKRIHSEYILSDIRKINFKPSSFDAVILIEVLEHLPKKDGERMLEKAETWASKKVIVSSPNGYFPQPDVNNNLYFRHLSGWDVEKMRNLDYEACGMAGLKFLRKENTSSKEADNTIFSTMKFRPKFFWLIISELTQLLTYCFPELAFEIFYVKQLRGGH